MASPPEGIFLLDGATGTELGLRGVDISPPLWSARALLEAPDTVRDIHHEYLEAGADAITTNTFRTHARTLAKNGLGEDAKQMTHIAVRLAREACDAVNPDALVLGSVAPLEDCYQPDLAPTDETCAREHREMMTNLLDAGVDLILIETMGTLREGLAAARVAEEIASGRWMISFLTKSVGPPGVLFSGESLIDALPSLGGAASIGINCVGAPAAEQQVKLLRRLLPAARRISVYANTGQPDERGRWFDTDAVHPKRYAEYAARWISDGATIVGGCCGTTPETIRAIARSLGRAGPWVL